MLQLHHVSKQYATKGGLVHALDDVSLTLPSTGMIFLIGTSGAGKSTLLHIIGGLDTVDQGEIRIQDRKTGEFSAKEFDSYRNTMIGFVFQDYNLLPEFTVAENIAIALELQGKKTTNEAVTHLLNEVGLQGLGSRRPATLSGGQKQRVAIARALIKAPAIIMADEPTGALDSATGKQVFAVLKKLAATKLVIVVSHDRDYAETYGDRIITLSDGKVIEDIAKTWTPPMRQFDHLAEVEPGLILIRPGEPLSENEKTWLLNQLTEGNDEVLIAVGAQRVTALRKPLRLQADDSREHFQTTIEPPYEVQAPLTLIASKLPLKASLKIAANSLKHKPLRLFFTILLSTLALTLFGLSDTMASFDKVESGVASMLESGIDYTTLVASEKISYSEDDFYYTPKSLSTSDLAHLQTMYSHHNFLPVYRSPDGEDPETYAHHLGNLDQLSYSYHSPVASGFLELSAVEFTALEFSLLGTWPSDDTQIALTSYQAEHFIAAGYQATATSPVETIASAQDLLGKTLVIKGHSLTISGIVNNEIDAKYDVLKDVIPPNEDWMTYYLLQSDWTTTINYGFPNLFFVNEGFRLSYGANSTYDYAIAQLVPNRSELHALMVEHYRDDVPTKFQLQNGAIFAIESLSFFVVMIQSIFLVFAVGLAVFSGLLLFNFISSSILYKKREIGVLRAVGARGSDVFAIFFGEALMIALLNFGLALLFCLIGASLLNQQLRVQSGLSFSLLVVRLRQVFLLFGIATGVSLLASFLPVWRIARKRPIDAIREV